MGRKLKKREVMIISRLLDKVNFKIYAEYLLNNKVDKLVKLLPEHIKENKENIKNQSALASLSVQLIGDVLAFIVQNMYKAESEIDELIMSYKNVTENDLENYDIDELTETLKEIFFAGVPKVISNFIDISDIKKKLMKDMQT